MNKNTNVMSSIFCSLKVNVFPSIGGSEQGSVRVESLPPGPLSFIFMQFSANILPSNRFAPPPVRVGAPIWEILDTPLPCFKPKPGTKRSLHSRTFFSKFIAYMWHELFSFSLSRNLSLEFLRYVSDSYF